MESKESFFIEQIKEIGKIKTGSKTEIIFKAKANIPDIEEIVVSCGCTKPRFSALSKELKVIYTAGSIKNDKLEQVNFAKTLTVYYKFGQVKSEVLKITGTKIRK